MTTYQGTESRYLNRFSKIKQQTGNSIKNYDSAGNLTEHLSNARASLKAQEKNTKDLFSTAQELIIGIDTCQQMFGHTFVRNMPLPSTTIKESPSQQLGYVQLTMRFLQAGVVHFMEQMDEATDRIEHLERLLEKLAVYDQDIDIQGELQPLDLDQLEADEKKPGPVASDVTQQPKVHDQKEITPPATPTSETKEKLPKKDDKTKSSHKKK